LRGRPLDIALLVQQVLDELTLKHGVAKSLTHEAMWRCGEYSWPGNVRQLRKAIERAYWLSGGRVIDWAEFGFDEGGEEIPPIIPTLREVEKEHIKRVLSAVSGNKSQAARLLGVKRTTLYSQMQALGLWH
jgi:DNA-binding NtrC family response regulator